MEKAQQFDESGIAKLPDSDDLSGYATYGLINNFMSGLVSGTSCRLPPHGGRRRDVALRDLATTNESLQSILYTVSILLYNLGLSLQVVPDNSTIGSHQELARYYNSMLKFGLHAELERAINDFLTLDNGCFILVEANSPYHEPASGPITGLRTLDGLCCIRTRNDTYPVVYQEPGTGARYPLHVSRIIFFNQYPSNDWQKNKIGFSSVSRLNRLARHLEDIGTHDLERLGSLESSQIIHATGASQKELKDAIATAERGATNEGRQRRGKTVFLASRDPSAKLSLLNLKEGDTGASKVSDIEVTLALVALAVGINAYLILESTQSSSTRASARESIRLSEGKLFAYFYNKLTMEISSKVLPPSLKIVQSGEQMDIDSTKSRNSLNRATTSKQNIESGVTTQRIERELLFARGEITQTQFDMLELSDERLPSGLHISTLFYNKAFLTKKLLKFDYTDDPLNEEISDAFISEITTKMLDVVTALDGSTSQNISRKLTQVLYALQWLENQLQAPDDDIDTVDVSNDVQTNIGPRDVDLIDEVPRDTENENAELEKTAAAIDDYDWLYEALAGNLDYESNYQFTKEAPRRFRRAIRDVTRGLWSGELTKPQFEEQLNGSLTNLLTSAYEGTVENVYGSEVIPDAAPLNRLLDRTKRYVSGYADYVIKLKKGVGKLKTVYQRADLWINLHDEVTNLAKLDKNGEDTTELRWLLGNTEESCGTCLEYSNTIKTKAEWADLAADGIYPQSRALICAGYHCQCSLQPI